MAKDHQMAAVAAIEELGFCLHHLARLEVVRVLCDLNLAGLLSYAKSGMVPGDLAERYRAIKVSDALLAEAITLANGNDLARAYLAYLDMKRSYMLHHFAVGR
jgi:hypothetical protein